VAVTARLLPQNWGDDICDLAAVRVLVGGFAAYVSEGQSTTDCFQKETNGGENAVRAVQDCSPGSVLYFIRASDKLCIR
jgi:3-mercaptopyruvate sulfurtransferase SseA